MHEKTGFSQWLSKNRWFSNILKNIQDNSSEDILRDLNLTRRCEYLEAINQLCEVLKENTQTKSLYLTANNFADYGTEQLADLLAVNSSLKSLSLAYCDINDSGAENLAKALRTNHNLTFLNIENLIHIENKISFIGAARIAEGLQCNYGIRTLILRGNNIGSHGAKSIANALKLNTALIELDISTNDIDEGGAIHFAEALYENNTLNKLTLHMEYIGCYTAAKFKKALQQNITLCELDLVSGVKMDVDSTLFTRTRTLLRSINESLITNKYGYCKESKIWQKYRATIMCMMLLRNASKENKLHILPIEIVSEIFSHLLRSDLALFRRFPGCITNWYKYAENLFAKSHECQHWDLSKSSRYAIEWEKKSKL